MSRARRFLGWPLRAGIDPRVQLVNARIQRGLDETRAALRAELADLDARMVQRVHEQDERTSHVVREQRDLLRDEILEHVSRQLGDLHLRFSELHGDWIDRAAQREALGSLSRAVGDLYEELARATPSDGSAANRALAMGGPAWKAGLAFTPAVPITFTGEGAEARDVNERILEIPYALQALKHQSKTATVLDLGGAFSTLALSLAALGHSVTVVDPLGYSLTHPNLHVVGAGFQELGDEIGQFDAALAVSTIGHLGLGGYGPDEGGEPDLDRRALGWLRERVRPEGLLIVTVPLGGARSETPTHRVYDAPGIRGLLEGWEIVDFSAGWADGRAHWRLGSPDGPGSDRGVALVTARRPAD